MVRGVAIVSLVCVSSEARAEKDLTIELGAGPNLVVTHFDEVGWGGSVAFGFGWRDKRTVIGGRVAVLSARLEDFFGTDIITTVFLGAAVQHWFNDRVWIGGALGLAPSCDGDHTLDCDDIAPLIGVDGRIGVQLVDSLHASFEFMPLVFPGGVIKWLGVGVGYQFQ